jgi:hypothetical protein
MIDYDTQFRNILTQGNVYTGPTLPIICDRCQASQRTRGLHLGDSDLCDECVSILRSSKSAYPSSNFQRPVAVQAQTSALTLMEQRTRRQPAMLTAMMQQDLQPQKTLTKMETNSLKADNWRSQQDTESSYSQCLARIPWNAHSPSQSELRLSAQRMNKQDYNDMRVRQNTLTRMMANDYTTEWLDLRKDN